MGNVHYQVGKKVRQTIVEFGGTISVDLQYHRKALSRLKRKKRKDNILWLPLCYLLFKGGEVFKKERIML